MSKYPLLFMNCILLRDVNFIRRLLFVKCKIGIEIIERKMTVTLAIQFAEILMETSESRQPMLVRHVDRRCLP